MPATSADFISIIERLAKQEVRMEAVRKDIVDVREGVHQGFDKLDARFATIEARLATTEDIVKTARIGWRTLVAVGSVILTLAGTAGALIAKWLPFAGGFPK